MRFFVDFVLKNKLAIWLFTFILLLFGIYSGSKMNLESLPNMELPYVVVSTSYGGATAETVDKEVSSKISNVLENMQDVKKVNSTSYNNFSMVFAEFEYGIDIDKINKDLNKSLEKVVFADGVGDSEIMEISMNSLPIVIADISSKDLSAEKLSEIVNGNLISELNKVSGIGDISLSGLSNKKALITYNSESMSKYQIDKETLNQLIKSNNSDIALGLINFKDSQESVLVNTDFKDIKGLLSMNLPFRDDKGKTLLLSDLISIEEINESTGISRTNGSAGLSLSIIKSNSANTVNVVNDVKSSFEEFNKMYKDIKITYVLDQGEPIEDSVKLMLEKVIFGALIAILVILFFLRDWRSTIIAVISIPLSLLLALIVLNLLEISLNLMTLAAMTVAIGRVIDDSIVVVENIYRRLTDSNETLYGRALIKESTIQMFIPITSSTVVTVIVFAPLMLVGGMVGEMFMPFALTMVFSLLASLLVAISVVPVLAHTLFKGYLYDKNKKIKEHKQKDSGVYRKVLEWSLNNKIKVLLFSIGLVVGSILLLSKVDMNFMPAEESNQLSYKYEAENGELESDLESHLVDVEKVLLNNKNYDIVKVSLSEGSMFSLGETSVTVDITLADDINSEKESKNVLDKLADLKHPGEWKAQSSASPMGGNTNGVSYSIYGNSVEDLENVSDELVKHLKEYKNLEEVTSSLNSIYKENVLSVDIEKASEYGLTAGQVGLALLNYSSDNVITSLGSDNDKLDIIERTESVSFDSINNILEKPISILPNGVEIKVKDVVTLSEGSTLSEVTKENGRWVATVSGNLTKGNVSEISVPISKFISDLKLPLGVEIDEGGVSAQMKESFMQLGLAMLAAIFLVYLSLVVTFKEGLAPFVILMSLPFTIIGVVLILLITNTPLDVSGMLGLLMLIGIVVTNAIVMVDRILENEYSGKDLRESIIEASLVRLRPILMTAIATVATLLPLVFGETVGLIGKGLGLTVIGGLLTSTILTLIIIPVLYELLSKLFRKDRKNIRHD